MKLNMMVASLILAFAMCGDGYGQGLLGRLTNRCCNDCGTSCCDTTPACNSCCRGGGFGFSLSLDINFQLPQLLRRRGCCGCDTGCGGCDNGCGCDGGCVAGCGCDSGCGGCDSGCGCGCGGGGLLSGLFSRRGCGCRSGLLSGLFNRGGCGCGCDTGCDSGCGCDGGCVSTGCGCDSGCDMGCYSSCGCGRNFKLFPLFKRCGNSCGLLSRLRGRMGGCGCNTGCGGCDSGCGCDGGCASGCGGGCDAGCSNGCDGGAVPSQVQPVMENAAPDAVTPVPAAPSQPSASDGAGNNTPVVDPSAFIFRGQRQFGVN